MPTTTSTTRTRHSERRTGLLSVVARNARARSRPAQLVAVFADPTHRATGWRIAVVTATRPPFIRCLTVLPGGGESKPPEGGPPAPAVVARRAA